MFSLALLGEISYYSKNFVENEKERYYLVQGRVNWWIEKNIPAKIQFLSLHNSN